MSQTIEKLKIEIKDKEAMTSEEKIIIKLAEKINELVERVTELERTK